MIDNQTTTTIKPHSPHVAFNEAAFLINQRITHIRYYKHHKNTLTHFWPRDYLFLLLVYFFYLAMCVLMTCMMCVCMAKGPLCGFSCVVLLSYTYVYLH